MFWHTYPNTHTLTHTAAVNGGFECGFIPRIISYVSRYLGCFWRESKMFPLIFWSRWTEHIYNLKVLPKHSKHFTKHLLTGPPLSTVLLNIPVHYILLQFEFNLQTINQFHLFSLVYTSHVLKPFSENVCVMFLGCLKKQPASWTWWAWLGSCSSSEKRLSLSCLTLSQILETTRWQCQVNTQTPRFLLETDPLLKLTDDCFWKHLFCFHSRLFVQSF